MPASSTRAPFTYLPTRVKRSELLDHNPSLLFHTDLTYSVPPEPDLSTTDVCYKGVVYGTQLAVHFMRQNPTPGGFIIATASAVALYPVASLPEYTGAKAAVLNPRNPVARGRLTTGVQVNGFVEACAPILKLVSLGPSHHLDT